MDGHRRAAGVWTLSSELFPLLDNSRAIITFDELYERINDLIDILAEEET